MCNSTEHKNQMKLDEDDNEYCEFCEQESYRLTAINDRQYIGEFRNKDMEKTMWGDRAVIKKHYPDRNSMYDYVGDNDYDCIIYRKDGKKLSQKEIGSICTLEAVNFTSDFEYIPLEIKIIGDGKKLVIRRNDKLKKKMVLKFYKEHGIDDYTLKRL